MQQLPTILPPPTAPDSTEAPVRSQEQHSNLVRFQSELEVWSYSPTPQDISAHQLLRTRPFQFIQCLANPLYLHELFSQGFLDQPEFINYLEYLEYWRDPAYVRFIMYVVLAP